MACATTVVLIILTHGSQMLITWQTFSIAEQVVKFSIVFDNSQGHKAQVIVMIYQSSNVSRC